MAVTDVTKYAPGQARDQNGRFAGGGGVSMRAESNLSVSVAAYDEKSGAKVQATLVEALGAIGEVHEVPDISKLDVVAVDKKLAKTMVGQSDVLGWYTPQLPGKLHVNTDLPVDPLTTVVHEFGHMVDHEQLGWKDPGEIARPLSLYSAGDENIGKILDLGHNAPSARRYRETASDYMASYVSSNTEIFARAYTQWVATRSSNPRLLDVLKADIARDPSEGWTDEEFEPIGQAMDDLFRERGLLNEKVAKYAPGQPRDSDGRFAGGMRTVASVKGIRMNSPLNTTHVDTLASRMRAAGKYVGAPVQIETMGNGTELLTDGHHRLAAAEAAGITEIPVRVYPATDAGRLAATTAVVEADRQKFDDVEAWHAAGDRQAYPVGHYSDFPAIAPAAERAAERYAGSDFETINNALRSDSPLSARDAATADTLTSALREVKTSKPAAVSRLMDSNEFTATLTPGETFVDKGFTSTSYAQNGEDRVKLFGTGDLKMELLLPAGTHAATIPAMGEAEVLLPPGSEFKVMDAYDDPSGKRYIRAELVGQSIVKYAPGQARDDNGRFASGGGTVNLAGVAAAISKVHDTMEIPNPTVRIVQDELAPGVGGDYHYASREIRVKATSTTPELIFAHELGHHIDRTVFGRGDYSGTQITQGPGGPMKEILGEMKSTPEYQAWVNSPNGRYYASKTEMFARGYAQWVAIRSGDPTLVEQLAKRTDTWTTESFEPIAAAYDTLFTDKGLIK